MKDVLGVLGSAERCMYDNKHNLEGLRGLRTALDALNVLGSAELRVYDAKHSSDGGGMRKGDGRDWVGMFTLWLYLAAREERLHAC